MEVAWRSGSKELKLFFDRTKRTSHLIEKDHLGDWSPGWGLLLVTLVIANNCPSQAFNPPDDHSQSRYVIPAFNQFSYVLLNYLVEKAFWKIDSIITQNLSDILLFFFGSNIAVSSHKCNQARSKERSSIIFQIWIKFRYKSRIMLTKMDSCQ